jgi:DNA invertase Pin-like site-specific DNA recombinase
VVCPVWVRKPYDRGMTKRYVGAKRGLCASTSRRVGYARVSTLMQGSEGAGIAAQRALLLAAGCSEADIHVEVGSGRRAENRPILCAVLDDLCTNGGSLVVAKLDRLARSNVDAGHIAERLTKCGVELVVLDIGLDTSTAVGKAMFSMVSVMAELESDLISERTSAARGAIRSGLADGRLGGRAIQFDRDEALRLVAAGLSYRAVAEQVGTTKSSIADVVKRHRLAEAAGT